MLIPVCSSNLLGTGNVADFVLKKKALELLSRYISQKYITYCLVATGWIISGKQIKIAIMIWRQYVGCSISHQVCAFPSVWPGTPRTWMPRCIQWKTQTLFSKSWCSPEAHSLVPVHFSILTSFWKKKLETKWSENYKRSGIFHFFFTLQFTIAKWSEKWKLKSEVKSEITFISRQKRSRKEVKSENWKVNWD